MVRLRWRSGALAPLFVLASVSCSGDSPSDAGIDAGAIDAGTDAGVRDAGSDAADAQDAGPPGPWTQVPGLPGGCIIETTTDGSLMGALRRESCPGRAGCEQLVPEWNTGLINFRVDGGYDDGAPTFFFLRTVDGISRLERWLVRDDGSPVLGIRSSGRTGVCLAAAFTAMEGRFAFVGVEPYDGGDRIHSWVFAGEWDARRRRHVSIRNLGRLSDLLPVRTSNFAHISIGATRLAVESAPWHSILDVTWDGVATLVGDPTDGGETYVSSIVGDTVLYDVYGFPPHVRAATAGAHGEVLIAPAGAGANAAVTDGVDLAWVQSYTGPTGEVERLELWASPWAARAGDLVPRKVADVDGANASPPTVIGSGYVAVLEPTGGDVVSRVYRLSDGARATVPEPEGRQFRVPAAYIGPEIIAVPLGLIGSPPEDEALMLIRLDSLDFVLP